MIRNLLRVAAVGFAFHFSAASFAQPVATQPGRNIQGKYSIAQIGMAKKVAATMSKDGLLRELRTRELKIKSSAVAVNIPQALEPLPDLEVEKAYDDVIKSLYGDDNRKDVYTDLQVGDDEAIFKLADSEVALVSFENLASTPDGGVELPGDTFGDRRQLCIHENFRMQPCAAYGSGMLVGDDLVLTAGHCIGNAQFPLGAVRFVFGYRMKDSMTPVLKFPASEVYSAARVVGRMETATGSDWALVQLDRKVSNHAPVPVAKFSKTATEEALRYVPDQTAVFTLGHPCGLPLKYTANGTISASSRDLPFFSCNLDTYAGNSGSAVLAKIDGTYKIVGVLVRGMNDFEDFVELNTRCRRSVIYRLDQAQEACTRSSEFIDLLSP